MKSFCYLCLILFKSAKSFLIESLKEMRITWRDKFPHKAFINVILDNPHGHTYYKVFPLRRGCPLKTQISREPLQFPMCTQIQLRFMCLLNTTVSTRIIVITCEVIFHDSCLFKLWLVTFYVKRFQRA